MNDSPRYVTVRDYLRVLRKHRFLIAVIAVLFAGLAYAHAKGQKATYESEAKLQFSDQLINPQFIGSITPEDIAPDQRATIHASRIYSLQIAQRAAAKLHLSPAAAPSLLSQISTRAEAKTDFIVVTADTTSPATAASYANAYAEAARDQVTADTRGQYSQAVNAIQRQINSLGTSITTLFNRTLLRIQQVQMQQGARLVAPVSIVGHAGVPGAPTSPHPSRDGVLGLIAGLSLGILLAFARDGLDRRFKSSSELSEALQLPIVGFVREDALGRTTSSSNGAQPLDAPDVEGFRILRTNLESLDIDSPPKTVMITSAVAQEGKSTVAAALATAHAQAGRRTLLLECDLRSPTLAKRLGVAESPGLTDYLVNGGDPRQTIEMTPGHPSLNGHATDLQSPPAAHVDCIVAGSHTPSPAELLGSQRFASFLEEISAAYEAVVIDAAPLLPVVDALEMLGQVDGVVVCVRVSRTTRDQASAAKTALERFPGRPTGVVITGLRSGEDADAYGAYGYSSTEKRVTTGPFRFLRS
jgi:receptor protein-tyrosine kinase